MRWAILVARMGEYSILVGNLEGKGTLARPRRRCKMNLKTKSVRIHLAGARVQ
jgi:hypothetical protein